MALTGEEIDQPFVGVASCWRKPAPCNIVLMRQLATVKKGAAGRAIPREFATIAVADGVAMVHNRTVPQNAPSVVAASGGSADLPAIADECGIAFDLFDVDEVFKRTPYIADLKRAGRFVAKDLFDVGDVPLLMKILLDNGFMHVDCMPLPGAPWPKI